MTVAVTTAPMYVLRSKLPWNGENDNAGATGIQHKSDCRKTQSAAWGATVSAATLSGDDVQQEPVFPHATPQQPPEEQPPPSEHEQVSLRGFLSTFYRPPWGLQHET